MPRLPARGRAFVLEAMGTWVNGVWCPGLRPITRRPMSAPNPSSAGACGSGARRPFSAPAFMNVGSSSEPLELRELPAPEYSTPTELPHGITAAWLTKLLYDGKHQGRRGPGATGFTRAPGHLPDRLHRVWRNPMEYSECLPTLLSPPAENALCPRQPPGRRQRRHRRHRRQDHRYLL